MTRPGIYTLILLLILAVPAAAGDIADVTLYFSPRGECQAAIVNTIADATKTIEVAAYAFSNKRIAKALYNARKRNVNVRIVVDRKQPTTHYSILDDLVDHGLYVRIDRRESLMHMKSMIIDRRILIAGSYNFTEGAQQRNAEILTIIKSKAVAAKATANWQSHWDHSSPHKLPKNATCKNESCPTVPKTTFRRPQANRGKSWSK